MLQIKYITMYFWRNMLTEVIIKSSFRNNEKSSLFLIFLAMKVRTYRNKFFLPGMQWEISIVI